MVCHMRKHSSPMNEMAMKYKSSSYGLHVVTSSCSSERSVVFVSPVAEGRQTLTEKEKRLHRAERLCVSE